MKLYDHPVAPNPRRVRVFLAEKGITVPTETIDLLKGEHRTPEFLALDPLGRVPLLVLDNGRCLAESVSICRYFEALHPTPCLFGEGAEEQAFVDMWQRRVELELFFPIAHAVRHGIAMFQALEPVQLPQWAELSAVHANEAMIWLDKTLAERPFIAGENFSVADITAMCAFDFSLAVGGPKLPENLSNLRRWRDQVSARPSAAA